ncbi:hypothetical protein [Clostridium perfringens]|uniref:Uncharacterized protein n=2 Tax=Clostridium perfringens TaxID=1502 RepID=A0AAP7BUM6_CLOPF|nr:hypothetical protein [Clostridium perfringens]MCX0415661.1 hypothetical protein [Clostridium perfringens]NGU29033.1 hypothetical protein [Clostridium perfringens]WEV04018.1 hypothetical protein PL322_08325 [Clostridium perfringens B]WEV07156.1 hypothetical protein PL324_08595 [Clostridium perfringens B]
MSEFKKIIKDYIHQCDIALEINNENLIDSLVDKIIAIFEVDIPDIKKGQECNIIDLNGDGYSYIADKRKNLILLKNKLEAYSAKLNDGIINNRTMENKEGVNLVVNNTNNNINNNTNNNTNNNLEILFKKAKEEVENNESLSEEEINEVLEKIKEIEKISESDEAKNKKWFKLRPTMEWLGTKGVSVATAVLGLITAVLKMK